MSPASSHNSDHSDHSNYEDPRLKPTVEAVNWDVLLGIACKAQSVSTASWGKQVNGGYNVVRFLKLDDGQETEIVVRVPYKQEDGTSDVHAVALARRIESEVASMEYVAANSTIPLPRIIAYSTEKDGGGVGSPFIIMTKVEGEQLVTHFDDMDDTQREAILRQVIDITLQFSKLRFDKIGALFKGDGVTKPAYYVAPLADILGEDDLDFVKKATSKTYTNAVSYWNAIATANLEEIHREQFGRSNKSYEYVMYWFIRSLVPALYDTGLDENGFPLTPGDFHSQNILITDVDTRSPRITGIIDWEFTSTDPTTSYAQYPLFIVDHPAWPDDHPTKKRNIKDQKTFNRLVREAESKLDPNGDLPLSRAFEKSAAPYMLQQCLTGGMFSALYERFFNHIYGQTDDSDEEEEDSEKVENAKDEGEESKEEANQENAKEKEEDSDDESYEEKFSVAYYDALMKGILKKEAEQYDEEFLVKKAATAVLGEDVIVFELTRQQFKAIVLENLDKFEEGSRVKRWLKVYGGQK
ncbi:hypothetical protein FA15DRAFT_663374 [Coprinopsis marcescibilis]|uniref:Aminoglycoside phosphotransferase domain-containing protein n=1 Tax=Coprinopsis marcescibilis TaxID=230819 RepID=A0A5C3LDR2_COPMA|nr:hypothetical protein FA15DRAFT_663374 [Coprinopsis marcescibilis]